MARTKGSLNIIKNLDAINFPNVRIRGILFNEKDLLLCMQLATIINSTSLAKKEFSKNEYINWIKRKHFGKFAITKFIKDNVNSSFWNFDTDLLVAFTHERGLNSLSLENKCFFEVDVNLYPTSTNLDIIKNEYINIANIISELSFLKNDEYVEFNCP